MLPRASLRSRLVAVVSFQIITRVCLFVARVEVRQILKARNAAMADLTHRSRIKAVLSETTVVNCPTS